MEHHNWDKVIRPQSKWFDLRLKEVWRYRDLLGLLVKRDFVAFYKQTILGPVWFFIQPLFTMAIYVFVFNNLAALSTDGLPPALFYLVGITAWSYFSDCLLKTSSVFKDNVHIFGKVYFPRLIMPFSIVVSNLVRFAVQLFLLVLVMIYFKIQNDPFSPSVYLACFPILVILMAAQGLGWGMIVSSLTTKYRDLALLLTFAVQLLMYTTTVIYPLSSLSGTRQALIGFNPMTPIIEGMRMGLLGQGTFNWGSLYYAGSISLIILIIGAVMFNKVEKNFVDTI